METRNDSAQLNMLTASALASAGVTIETAPGAGIAIMHRVMHGDPIPPDYWPELQRCTDTLRELIEILEGTA